MAVLHHQRAAGEVVGERYEIVRPIGAGAMGSLCEALDRRVSKRVAIKFLSPRLVSNPTVTKRFEREAHALGQIRHDHVCGVSDYGVTADGSPFIVMDLLEGEPLSDVLDREERLPPRHAIEVVVQVLSALSEVHGRRIVHRDLKPANIFMARGSLGDTRVKLIDFGIAKFLDASSTQTKEGTSIGTPLYMSPEQISGKVKETDVRTDLWAVGIILYECLSGASPFRATNPNELAIDILINEPLPLRERDPSLPPALEAVIGKALSKDPDQRFQDASDFAAALMDVEAKSLATWPGDTTPSSPPVFEPVPEVWIGSPAPADSIRVPTTRRWLVPLIVGGLLAAGAVGGLFTAGLVGDRSPEPPSVTPVSEPAPAPRWSSRSSRTGAAMRTTGRRAAASTRTWRSSSYSSIPASSANRSAG
jgi:serine/threonine-protein kinase